MSGLREWLAKRKPALPPKVAEWIAVIFFGLLMFGLWSLLPERFQ